MANLRRALITAHRLLKSSSFATASDAPARASTVHPSPILRAQQHIWFSQYSTVRSNDGRSLDIDLSNEEGKRRLFNRLLYRSKQRGYLELDLVLGKWVEENIHSMDENGIKALADVLDLENPDLWKWLIGQEQAPDIVSKNSVFSAVRETITNNLNNHSAPETRATPGKPWVRGWDDIKKGLNSPVAGNQ